MSNRVPVTFGEKLSYVLRRGVAEAKGAARLRTVVNDNDLTITAAPGRGDEALVVFNSVHAKMAGESPAEFMVTATAGGARHALFVTDHSKAWFQGEQAAERIVAAIQAYLQKNRLRLKLVLGVSMGGYGAAVFAARLGAPAALAIAAQWDVGPDAVEKGWKAERAAIDKFRLGPAGDHFTGVPRIYAIHGQGDRWHAAHYAQAAGVLAWVKARCPHNVAGKLKEAGLLTDLVAAAYAKDDDQVARLMEQFGADRGVSNG